jgi:hypothetical protein
MPSKQLQKSAKHQAIKDRQRELARLNKQKQRLAKSSGPTDRQRILNLTNEERKERKRSLTRERVQRHRDRSISSQASNSSNNNFFSEDEDEREDQQVLTRILFSSFNEYQINYSFLNQTFDNDIEFLPADDQLLPIAYIFQPRRSELPQLCITEGSENEGFFNGQGYISIPSEEDSDTSDDNTIPNMERLNLNAQSAVTFLLDQFLFFKGCESHDTLEEDESISMADMIDFYNKSTLGTSFKLFNNLSFNDSLKHASEIRSSLVAKDMKDLYEGGRCPPKLQVSRDNINNFDTLISSFDVDSIIGIPSSLAVFRKGFDYFTYPNAARNIQLNIHIDIKIDCHTKRRKF